MYNDNIKGLLELNPNIKTLWINEAGEWFTSETADCKEVKKDEILKPTKKAKENE